MIPIKFWCLALCLGLSTAMASPLPPIIVHPGQKEVTIRLGQNPSTGFSWYLSHYDRHMLDYKKYQFIPANHKLIGTPGSASFTFSLKPVFSHIPQQITWVSFLQLRPWESTNQEQKQDVAILINQPSDTNIPLDKLKHQSSVYKVEHSNKNRLDNSKRPGLSTPKNHGQLANHRSDKNHTKS